MTAVYSQDFIPTKYYPLSDTFADFAPVASQLISEPMDPLFREVAFILISVCSASPFLLRMETKVAQNESTIAAPFAVLRPSPGTTFRVRSGCNVSDRRLPTSLLKEITVMTVYIQDVIPTKYSPRFRSFTDFTLWLRRYQQVSAICLRCLSGLSSEWSPRRQFRAYHDILAIGRAGLSESRLDI